NGSEWDPLQQRAPEDQEPGRDVAERNPREHAGVERPSHRDQEPAELPVHDRDAVHVPAARNEVVDRQGVHHDGQIPRVVREVRVHLDERLVVALDGPAIARDVRGPKTHLGRAMHDVNALVATGDRIDDATGAVRRIVVHDEHVRRGERAMDLREELLDVLGFVVGRNDDQARWAHEPARNGLPDAPSRRAQAEVLNERRWRRGDTMGYADIRVRIRSLTPLLIAGLALAYLLAHPLAIGKADESHLLYAAKRVLHGEVLYRDVFETITPLSFYLFAAIFRIAGTTLVAARVTMAVIEAVGCALLFRLVRRLTGVAEAVLVTLVFVCVCIPAWPFASPHWISTVLGLLVATVTLSQPSSASSRVRSMVAGMLAGVAVCVQQQRGVFLAAWLPLAFAVLACSAPPGERWRTFASQAAWGAAGGAAVVLAVIGHAAW